MAKKEDPVDTYVKGFFALIVFFMIPGWLFSRLFTDDLINQIIFSFVFSVVLVVILFIFSRLRKKKLERLAKEEDELIEKQQAASPRYYQKPSQPARPVQPPKPSVPPAPVFISKIQSEIPGHHLAYRYDNKGVAMANSYISDFSTLKPGDPLSFQPEPDNPYDSGAIAILHNDKHIGYVFRGQTQDMVRDYLSRKDPIRAFIQSVSSDEKSVHYEIGFYKPGSKKDDLFAGIKFLATGRLTNSGSESAQDNILFCNPGDDVTVDFDYEKDRYEVYAHDYIGTLPAKLKKYAETASFVITEIGETDTMKSYVIVGAYEELDPE